MRSITFTTIADLELKVKLMEAALDFQNALTRYHLDSLGIEYQVLGEMIIVDMAKTDKSVNDLFNDELIKSISDQLGVTDLPEEKTE